MTTQLPKNKIQSFLFNGQMIHYVLYDTHREELAFFTENNELHATIQSGFNTPTSFDEVAERFGDYDGTN